MTFLELFAGIGGFRRGLENAGFTCVGFVEWDKFARQSYEAIWPSAKGEWSAHDITKVSEEDLLNLKSQIGELGMLAGGFPCQAFSVAGKRGGFEDTRGTLFFEVARYAKAMQPKWIIAENVRGLLNHDNGRTFRVILDTLNEIGYDVDFHVYNATEFNIPQNRERVFILGKRRDIDIINMPIEAVREPFEQRLLFDLAGNLFDDGVSFFSFPWPKGEGVHRTLADVLEPEVDEKYFLSEQMEVKIRKAIREDVSDDLADTCCELRLTELTQGVGDAFRVYDTQMARNLKAGGKTGLYQVGVVRNGRGEDTTYHEREIALTIDANYYKGLDAHQARTGVAVRAVIDPARPNKTQNGRRIKDDGEPMFTLTAQDRHGVMIEGRIGGWVDREDRLFAYQNDIKRSTAQEHVYIKPEGIADTVSTGHMPKMVTPEYRIRRLTPLETWRLMGRDDWEHEAAKAEGVSDSQRYKQAGNSLIPQIVETIGRRIHDIETAALSGY